MCCIIIDVVYLLCHIVIIRRRKHSFRIVVLSVYIVLYCIFKFVLWYFRFILFGSIWLFAAWWCNSKCAFTTIHSNGRMKNMRQWQQTYWEPLSHWHANLSNEKWFDWRRDQHPTWLTVLVYSYTNIYEQLNAKWTRIYQVHCIE